MWTPNSVILKRRSNITNWTQEGLLCRLYLTLSLGALQPLFLLLALMLCQGTLRCFLHELCHIDKACLPWVQLHPQDSPVSSVKDYNRKYALLKQPLDPWNISETSYSVCIVQISLLVCYGACSFCPTHLCDVEYSGSARSNMLCIHGLVWLVLT